MISKQLLDIFLNDTTVGNERFELNRFKRQFTVFRQDQIGNTLVNVDEGFELPWNSIYHTLDNFNRTDYLDTPRLNDDLFIQLESNRKYLYHVTEPQFGDLKEYMSDKSYVYRTSGLKSTLMKLKSEYKAEYKYLDQISHFPAKRDALIIVNHNPLFRVFFRGKLTFYRKIMFILSSVFNTVLNLETDKIQFIHIPLTSQIFHKESFLRSKQAFDLPSVKYPYSSHWIFMAHFLNWLDETANTSFLREADKEKLRKVNLILSVPDGDGNLKAIIYNLGTLKDFNVKNRRYLRIINHLNYLAASGILDSNLLSNRYNVEIVEGESKEDDTTLDKEVIEEKEEPKTLPEIFLPKEEKEVLPKNTIKIGEVTDNDIDKIDDLIKTVTEDDKKDLLIRSHLLPNRNNTITSVVLEPTKEKKVLPKLPDKPLPIKKVVVETLSDKIDNRSNEWIDKQDKTTREKDRMRVLSRKYKNLTIDGDTLEDLINKPLEELDSYMVPVKLDIPDQSMIESKAIKFNEEYLRTTNKRHLAQVFTSFQDNGLVLTDLKKKEVNNAFDRIDEYSLTYLDLDTNTQSTMKVGIPKPDRFGKLKIGGQQMYIKNQLVNLPICKINSTTVSLSSGFNKTQVIRNTTVVSSFFSYIRKLIVKGVNQGRIEALAGMEEIEDNLSYEYIELAKRYSSLKLSGNGENINLFFNKSNVRNDKYGVLTGTVGDLSIYVDLNNTLHYLSSDRKVSRDLPDNYISLIYSHLNNTTGIKPLTEWVDVKLLDANFPIIFLLGYRFGLKNILDYLEVNYKLVDKKKNVIDSESSSSILEKLPSLKVIKDLGLSEDDYVIVGSSTLVAYGYPDGTNDIDIIISKDKAKELASNGLITPTDVPGNYKRVTKEYEADLNTLHLSRNEECLNDYFKVSHLIEGYRFLTFDATVAFYSALVKLKKLPKHIEKLNWLKKNKNPQKVKHEKSPTDIYIDFNDVTLVLDRYPLANSLILSGLTRFDTEKYYFNEFDSKDVYYSLLIDKGLGTNYIKGIDNFFDLFLSDQMTIDVLTQMGEPTNIKDLLIRATVMLTYPHHEVAASMSNHRLRGIEQINTIVFNELSRQYANYRSRKIKGSKFSVNPEAIYQRILQNETLSPIEETNPLHSIKESLAITYSGISGRSADSFVLRDRKYPEDGIGILSESTVDSSKIGINATLSVNPKITSHIGTLDTSKDIYSTEDSSKVLSIMGTMMPGSLGDDAKRLNMVTIQQGHVIGTYEKDVCRVRTGMEQVIPYMTTKTFTGVAKTSGTVTQINLDLGTVLVEYTDGTKEIFSIAEKYSDVAGSLVTNKMQLNVKVGDKVKKGDLICFNDKFFKKDEMTGEVSHVHGVNTTVAFFECEGTQEDSSRISRRLAHKLRTDTTHVRGVKLSCTNVIHQIANVGDEVLNTDIIMSFEDESLLSSQYSDANDELSNLLSKVNRRIPKAKYSGKVVRIEVFYSCELEDMTESVRKLVEKYSKPVNSRARLAKGTLDESQYYQVEKIKPGTKYKGFYFGDDSILFFFYIQEVESFGTGDKLIVGLQLKSTTMNVYDHPIVSESGKPVEMVFSAAKAYGRVVTSAFLIGGASRVLEEIENQAIDMYFE